MSDERCRIQLMLWIKPGILPASYVKSVAVLSAVEPSMSRRVGHIV